VPVAGTPVPADLAAATDATLLAEAIDDLARRGPEWARRLDPQRLLRIASDGLARRDGVTADRPLRAAA
jgi:hypothetical protein